MFALVTSSAAVRANAPAQFKRNVSARAGFKDSVAGKSNWNAYEGSDEKTLSPEELRAKNAAEEKEIQARRAAAAKKMEEERKAAGM
ncbi:predicted protein [Ostreococcus lucimarinus CCE9901]|uniref:Uncharacterized protein n=1 Tax=Ostreococcus lucimarinus (strain CCE9901) TaxID=436017 RepID=A4S9Z6_OSTLU|nr:predicted protein [Ostreococcus lucimarinus CCE9901]ABP00575.1 predicted protein [Ostreococcus lucimarinus CCE9901]|eukprot:XP_001422258.1 predicted protein [Ostreococcus lucimarinus CCE9901]